MFEDFLTIYFFKSVQIHMKDAESTEPKEKSNLRFFRFLFFRVIMVIFVTLSFISPILDEFKKNRKIYF